MSEHWSQLQLENVASRLRDARRRANLTQDAVARHLGVARTTVVAIEKGQRAVRPEELAQLSQLYRRPINELLRSETPPPRLAAQFRLALEHRRGETSEELHGAIEEIAQLADDYAEIERVLGLQRLQSLPPVYEIAGLEPTEAGAYVASAERNRLGLGDGPVLELRDLLGEEVGVWVFAPSLPSRVAGLFAYDPEFGAVVAVNADHPAERQRWSLAHEYGHLLTTRGRAEVTVLHGYGGRRDSERFADAFARNFLMPEQGLRRRFSDLRRGRPTGPSVADLFRLADSYQVSPQALTLRLEDLDLVSAGTWDRLQEGGLKVGEARRHLEIKAGERDRSLLPLRYEHLALEALEQGLITEVQFARLLRCDVIQARARAHQLQRLGVLTDDGSLAQLELDFGRTQLSGSSR